MTNSIIEAVQALVAAQRQDTDLELEAVVTMNGTGGVPFEVFKALYDGFVSASAQNVFDRKGCTNIVDAFYPDAVRGRFIVGDDPRYITKTRVALVDVCVDEVTGCLLRFNAKRELLIRSPPEPIIAPTCIRMSQRWTFVYKNRIMYTLTKTVTGSDKADAKNKDPTFEVEVELLRNKTYYRDNLDNDIAKSLIAKSVDIIKYLVTHVDNGGQALSSSDITLSLLNTKSFSEFVVTTYDEGNEEEEVEEKKNDTIVVSSAGH
jgi:hypothetical protein